MKIDILTLFPNMFNGPFDESIVKRAQDKKLIEINIHNLRKWTKDKYQAVDDRPYGGGVGMVMQIEPIYSALKMLKSQMSKVKCQNQNLKRKTDKQLTINNQQLTILLSPRGKLFNQKTAQRLTEYQHLIFICGHYEGVDERVSKYLVDEEISIGDYVLTGGELPAMIIVDSIARLLPGALTKNDATKNETFQQLTINNQQLTILEYPQYTRPENYKGWKVPKILLSGNHKKIKEWQIKEAVKITKKRRPELNKNIKY